MKRFFKSFFCFLLCSGILFSPKFLSLALERRSEPPLPEFPDPLPSVSDTDRVDSSDSLSNLPVLPTDVPDDDPPEPEPELPKFVSVDDSYFRDALFIGDSRTQDLCDYSGIEADFFCSIGMNVYKLFDSELSVGTFGKTDLITLLQRRQYGKIYFMLGINEIGYNRNQTAARIASALDVIRGLQPGAVIFLEANLHVSQSKQKAPVTNENINDLNERIRLLSDDKTVFYIDVNELFDDAAGALAEGYSSDGVHPYAKHYRTWAEWLKTKGILLSDPS